MNDLTGRKFGLLTVIETMGKNKHRHFCWRCSCDCGKFTIVVGHNLVSGNTRSCGCLQHKKRPPRPDWLIKKR